MNFLLWDGVGEDPHHWLTMAWDWSPLIRGCLCNHGEELGYNIPT